VNDTENDDSPEGVIEDEAATNGTTPPSPLYYNSKEAMCANGYDVVPVRGKRPFTKGWQNHDFCSDARSGKRKSSNNLGVKTGEVVAIDIDVIDAPAVSELVVLAADVLGWAPERIGKPPKLLLVYRTEVPFKKIISKWVNSAGDPHQIEILASGQQFVALGIHPGTGEPYEWDEELLSIPVDELTCVSEGDLVQYLLKAEEIMAAYGFEHQSRGGGGEVSTSDGATISVPDDDEFLAQLHAGGYALNQAEAGKWNGDCPFGDEHTGGKVDGFVYWQAGYHGGLHARAHCSHSACSERGLMDFEEAVHAVAGTTNPMGSLAEAIAGHAELSQLEPPEIHSTRNTKPVGLPETSNEIHDYVVPGILPDLSRTAGGGMATTQPPTIRNVTAVLAAIGGSVRYNEMTKVEEVRLPWLTSVNGYHLNRGYNELANACLYGHIKAGGAVKEALDSIALDNSFHPFRELIDGVKWDGKSRITTLADTLTLTEGGERKLLEIYLLRFGIQMIEGLFRATPGQLRGLLLLCGPQGIGKTRWFSSLVGGDPYFRDGVAVSSNATGERDFLMASTGHVLVELGELDATFRKADISHLKALLTRQTDTYRAPYAAKPQTYARRVVYCGSVNDTSVLVDPTGNTRFWPVEVAAVDADHSVDMGQFWAEMKVHWLAGSRWYLAPHEEELRAAAEYKYRVLSVAETEVEEYFTPAMMDTSQTTWAPFTCMSVCKLLDLPVDRKTLNEMGHALRQLTGSNHSGACRIKGVKKAWMLPSMKMASHLRIVPNKDE
jgi:putative DNA primase/helicase